MYIKNYIIIIFKLLHLWNYFPLDEIIKSSYILTSKALNCSSEIIEKNVYIYKKCKYIHNIIIKLLHFWSYFVYFFWMTSL